MSSCKDTTVPSRWGDSAAAGILCVKVDQAYPTLAGLREQLSCPQ